MTSALAPVNMQRFADAVPAGLAALEAALKNPAPVDYEANARFHIERARIELRSLSHRRAYRVSYFGHQQNPATVAMTLAYVASLRRQAAACRAKAAAYRAEAAGVSTKQERAA